MLKKDISFEDLKKLCRLVREIVALQEKYISQGFSCKEIAATFAKVYAREFENCLSPEIAAKIYTGTHRSQPLDCRGAAEFYCMLLSGEFLSAITEILKKTKE